MEHHAAVDIDVPEPDWLMPLEAADEVDGRIGFSGGEFPDGGGEGGVVAALAVFEFVRGARGFGESAWERGQGWRCGG